jgi:hypothetical protein
VLTFAFHSPTLLPVKPLFEPIPGKAATKIVRPIVEGNHCLTFNRVLARLGQGLTLFAGTPLASPLALAFCAPFLMSGATVVAVDGANCFNLYRLTEWARRKRLNSLALLNQLRIARAFTPFQLATILLHIGKDMERYRATRLVLTGLPDCLYDEELSEQEARTTFARCQTNLARLTERYTVLLFSDLPTHPVGGRSKFFDALVSQSRLVLEVGHTEPVSFLPVKAPGLLTLPKGESKHGTNHTNRQSSA